jgi:DNA-binding MarR family transcriptional regulator
MPVDPTNVVVRAELALRRIYARLSKAARGAGAHLNGQQAFILATFTDNMTVNDIMQTVYSGSNATYNLARLRDAKLIERTTVARDKRTMPLKRTKSGREVADAIRAELHAAVAAESTALGASS